jgi:hypothetical protein
MEHPALVLRALMASAPEDPVEPPAEPGAAERGAVRTGLNLSGRITWMRWD